MKHLTLILFLIIVLLVPVLHQTLAQAGKAAHCDPGAVIKQAANMTSTGDQKTDLAALLKLRDAISEANIACTGWTFSGQDDSKVFGPLTFPEGVYKITATTVGYLTADLKLVDPSCDFSDINIAMVSKGEGNTGAEKIVTIRHSCKVYLQLSLVDAPWQLTIEPLG